MPKTDHICTKCSTHTTPHPNWLCGECRKTQCDKCQKDKGKSTIESWFYKYLPNNRTAYKHYLCKACMPSNALYCVACSTLIYPEKPKLIQGSYYCDYCTKERIFTCKDCLKDVFYDDYGLNGRCRNCIDSNVEASFVIREYGYKPDPMYFFGDASNKLYIGMELEMEVLQQKLNNREDVAFVIAGSLPEVYIKSDGSIGYGFEVVTYPMSYEYFKTKFNVGLFEELAKAKKVHAWAATCGMHFHISRCAFTALHLYKFIKFLYQSQNFCEVIGQRSMNSYCQKILGTKTHMLMRFAKNERGGIRGFLNLNPPQTIELRFFRGNLMKDRILKNVDFIDAAYHFTQETSLNSLNAEFFLKWLKQKEGYTHLKDFIKTRKLDLQKWPIHKDWIIEEKGSLLKLPNAGEQFAMLGPYSWCNTATKLLNVPFPESRITGKHGRVYTYKNHIGEERVFAQLSDYIDYYKEDQRIKTLKETDQIRNTDTKIWDTIEKFQREKEKKLPTFTNNIQAPTFYETKFGCYAASPGFNAPNNAEHKAHLEKLFKPANFRGDVKRKDLEKRIEKIAPVPHTAFNDNDEVIDIEEGAEND